jgi:hypothetical protein
MFTDSNQRHTANCVMQHKFRGYKDSLTKSASDVDLVYNVCRKHYVSLRVARLHLKFINKSQIPHKVYARASSSLFGLSHDQPIAPSNANFGRRAS